MVYIGSADRIIHLPAQAELLPELMEKWFGYREGEREEVLIRSFAAHFYFRLNNKTGCSLFQQEKRLYLPCC